MTSTPSAVGRQASPEVDTGHAADPGTNLVRTALHLVLAVIFTSQLMIVLDSAIVNIALPDMRVQLGLSQPSLSWVVNAYTLAFGGLLLLGARAGDLLGRRRMLLLGMAVFVGASLAGGLATGEGLLLAARAVQGAGAALVAPSALALLMRHVPQGPARTRAIATYTVVSASGAAVGLIAGGLLTSFAGWRWVFFVNVPIGIAVLIVAARSLPQDAAAARERIDVAGALLATVGMTGLVYGFVRAASVGWADPLTLSAFAAGVVLLAVFVAVELRVTRPITPLHLFADRGRSTSYIARLLMVAGAMGTFFFMSQFLQTVLHWTPWQSGLAFLPVPVSVFLASRFVAATVAQRVSPRRLIAAGLVLSAAGLVWMSRTDALTSYLELVPGFVLLGLGNGVGFVALTAASLEGVQPQDAGAASGLVNVTQQLGGALGLAVLVTVFSSAAAAAPGGATAAFVAGADRGFLVAGGMLVAALAVVLVVMRGRTPGGGAVVEEPVEEPVVDDDLVPAG